MKKKRTILYDSNALYYYLRKEKLRPATVAAVNGVTRQTITEKLKRDINHLSLASYKQVAKALDKPVYEVIKGVTAIDETFRENGVL